MTTPLILKLKRDLATVSLSEFTQQAFPIVVPTTYKHNWHIEAISDHLEAVAKRQIRSLIINMPPRHMKSLTVNVFFPAWVWLQDPKPGLAVHPDRWHGPGVRFLSASHSQHNVTRDNVTCRKLMDSPWYQKNWPGRVQFAVDQNTKIFYTNTHGGSRFTTTVEGGVTGEGGDIIMVDDPIDAQDAGSTSKVMLENCERWFFESLSTRVTDPSKACFILVMQRLHELDLSGLWLARDTGAEHLMLPARYEPDHPYLSKTSLKFKDPRAEPGEVLWDAHFPEEAIADLESQMTPYAAAGQLQQRPAPREGGMFKPAWFEVVDSLPADCISVRAWDLAASVYKGIGDPDYTVGLRMSKDKKGFFYIDDVIRFRDNPDIVERSIRSIASQDGGRVEVFIPQDPGQAGKGQVSYLIRQLAGYRVHSERPTGDKATRAAPFASQAAAGNVKLVKGAWNKAFLDEIATFPMGRHDDQVDAASDAFVRLNIKPAPARIIRSFHMQR